MGARQKWCLRAVLGIAFPPPGPPRTPPMGLERAISGPIRAPKTGPQHHIRRILRIGCCVSTKMAIVLRIRHIVVSIPSRPRTAGPVFRLFGRTVAVSLQSRTPAAPASGEADRSPISESSRYGTAPKTRSEIRPGRPRIHPGARIMIRWILRLA